MNTQIVVATAACIAATGLGFAGPAFAQATKPAVAVEAGAGGADFLEFQPFDLGNAAVLNLGGRWFVSPRVSVGPEAVFFLESFSNAGRTLSYADLLLKATFDLVNSGSSGPRRVTPYLVAAGGVTVWLNGGRAMYVNISPGFGARIEIGRGIYIAPEFLSGFWISPPYAAPGLGRLGVSIGFRPGKR